MFKKLKPSSTSPELIHQIPLNKRFVFKLFITNTGIDPAIVKVYFRNGTGVVTDEDIATTLEVESKTTISMPACALSSDEAVYVETDTTTVTFNMNGLDVDTIRDGIDFGKPSIVSPAALSPVSDTQEFEAEIELLGAKLTPQASDWEVRRVDTQAVIDSSYDDAVNLTTWTPDLSTIGEDTDIEIRVRFDFGIDYGKTEWSDYVSYSFFDSEPLSTVYGVEIDESEDDPELAVTYIEGAVGKVAATRTTDGDWGTTGGDNPLFKDIKPCLVQNGLVNYYLDPNDWGLREDGVTASNLTGSDGDVMIEIPKMWYSVERITGTPDKLQVKVSREAFTGGKAYGHTRTTEGDRDFLYVGAYLGTTVSSSLRSISGATASDTKTIGTFRTEARNKTNNGTGEYDQMSFYPLTLLQCLYLICYKNLNSQVALGRGHVDDTSAYSATGRSNAAGMYAGQTTGNVGDYVKFAGIEDFYGNKNYWIDGLVNNSSRQVLTAFKSFNNTGSGYTNQGVRSSDNLSGFLKIPQGDSECGFIAKEVGSPASASTYYCDYADLNADRLACFGGNRSSADFAGAFSLQVNNSSANSYAAIGGRLIYL